MYLTLRKWLFCIHNDFSRLSGLFPFLLPILANGLLQFAPSSNVYGTKRTPTVHLESSPLACLASEAFNHRSLLLLPLCNTLPKSIRDGGWKKGPAVPDFSPFHHKKGGWTYLLACAKLMVFPTLLTTYSKTLLMIQSRTTYSCTFSQGMGGCCCKAHKAYRICSFTSLSSLHKKAQWTMHLTFPF